MRKFLQGKKSYALAGAAVIVAVYGQLSGELTTTEALEWLVGGGALATVRAAIAKAGK